MTVRRALAQACATLLCAATAHAAAPPLTLYTEDYPPYSWADQDSGRPRGMAVDIVDALMRRAGVAAHAPAVVPWARALNQATSRPDTCMFSAALVPERAALFRWIGPIGRNEMVMFARRSDHLVLRSLDDARRYRIGTYLDDASADYFGGGGFRLDVAPANRLNPAKLRKGRIDLWPVGRLPGLSMLREQGIADLEPVLSFDHADMYLACHLSMTPQLAERLNETLRAMFRDGEVKRIYAAYGYANETPPAPGAAPAKRGD